MNIAVCIKQVPDTGAVIHITADKTGIVTSGMEYVINPYDEYALEAALLLKDEDNTINVMAVSSGPPRCRQALMSALAVGADRGLFIDTQEDRSYDSYFAARMVGGAVAQAGVDLVLCGLQGADYNNGQFPFYLAKRMNFPVITNIYGVELIEDEKRVHACRLNADGAKIVFDVKLPAVLAFARGGTPLRYASLTGIVKARKKELVTVTAGKDAARCYSPVKVGELYRKEQARDNFIFTNEDGAAAGRLLDYLTGHLNLSDS